MCNEDCQHVVDDWLTGVEAQSFTDALADLLTKQINVGEVQLRSENERELILSGARTFFDQFSRAVIRLGDGRFAYFAPDVRSRQRGVSNCRAWAEYAIHAVTSGGAPIPGKEYHVRWYNHRKVENFDLIVPTLLLEGCVPVRKENPKADVIKFFGKTHEGGSMDVVVRLDEYGNANANLTEVTFEVSKPSKKKRPRLMPLSEAVETVVCHQAAGTNPPTDGGIIA